MKLTFLGATHEVTGSCMYLEACNKKILIDCGMEQGANVFENAPLPVAEAEIDMVFLTHAHIDHSGKLPLLYKNGFRGQVFSTCATARLCEVLLQDSAHIQEFEQEWRNRKAKRAGKQPYVPSYTVADAMGVLQCFVGYEYGEKVQVADGIWIRFVDAGHLLGSASVEVWISESGTNRKIVFSGDIGNLKQPILRDPQYLTEADYVVMESTYGDRGHGPRPDYLADLTDVLQTTFDRGGNVVIPSFAVGRTQEMLYFIRQIKEEGRLRGHGDFPVYVDSPLAIEATKVFIERMREDFDEEATQLLLQGINPISFAGLCTAVTSEESKAINFDDRPKVILSASGMCDAGRIKHHLKHNLWRPESTILFVGYQSAGTLGRAIADGAKRVKLFGEDIEVRAQVRTLAGVSGHADNAGLMRWISSFQKKPQKVFVLHGEDCACETLADRIRKELGMDAMAPYSGTVYDLAAGQCAYEAKPVRAQKKRAAGARAAVYDRLLAAGSRLLFIIRCQEGKSEKELAKFADQIDALCEKWERVPKGGRENP